MEDGMQNVFSRRWLLAGAVVTGSVALSGCASWWAVRDFSPSPLGGHTQGILALATVPPGPSARPAPIDDTGLDQAVAAQCGAPPAQGDAKPLGGAGAGLLGGVVEAAIQVWLDGQIRRAEAIGQAATASSGLTWVVPADDLRKARCLVITRRSPAAEGAPAGPLDLAAVLRLDHMPLPQANASAFRYQPVYVRLRRSVAVPRDEAMPRLRVSVAMAVKVFAPHRDGLPRLEQVGATLSKVADVGLGTDAPAQCADRPCPISDPLPLPLLNGPVSLSISIGEQGRTGLDVRAVSSDLKALRDVLGPAFGEAVKAAAD
jgi:hypothetical protein